MLLSNPYIQGIKQSRYKVGYLFEGCYLLLNMYKFIKIRYDILKQRHGDYMEKKKINDVL